MTMTILHTSDWHLGQQLYGFERTEEQGAMLAQIERIVRERRPEALLVSGDVYHTAQPSAAVQRMFSEAMVRMHKAWPEMTIVVTAGNHDSGTRHEIFRVPWLALNVHVVGGIDKENVDSHIIEIPGKGFVVAVPYSNERNLPSEFFLLLLDRVEERNEGRLPVAMMAHTTVSGCDFKGHDHASEFSVGGIDAFALEEMGEDYDYLALGHIHRAQFVGGGNHRARYCGTPLAVSFDETFSHSVTMIEIEKHGGEILFETIDIENPRPLVTLPTEGVATWEECRQLLADFPDDIPAYVRLNVLVEDFLPAEANAEAEMLTREKRCRFCYINAVREKQSAAERKMLTAQEFQTEKPIDIARRFAEDLGCDFDETMDRMFREVVAMVEEEKREDGK